MATGTHFYRNDAWQSDYQLEQEMKKFVKQGIKRREILDFLRREFPQYAWSIATLDRRLRHFNINYIDKNESVDEVRDAVARELSGRRFVPKTRCPKRFWQDISSRPMSCGQNLWFG